MELINLDNLVWSNISDIAKAQLASCEEQVEAGYISKEEHEKILRVNARTRKQLCERIRELKANSIPKDRVREIFEEIESLLGIEEDEELGFIMPISNHIPYENWLKLKQKYLGES